MQRKITSREILRNIIATQLSRMYNLSQILLLALVVCFIANVSVYCQHDTDKYPFDVDENENKVEKRVIKYTRSLPQPKKSGRK